MHKTRFEPDGTVTEIDTDSRRREWVLTRAELDRLLNRIGTTPDYTWPVNQSIDDNGERHEVL